MNKFAKDVVRKYFAPKNSESAIAKIEKHRQYLPVLIERYQDFYDNHTISWQPIFVDYSVRYYPENENLFDKLIILIDDVIKVGLSHPPVAITKQSNYLVARTMNIVRQTLGNYKDLGYIYDRTYEEQFYQPEKNDDDDVEYLFNFGNKKQVTRSSTIITNK